VAFGRASGADDDFLGDLEAGAAWIIDKLHLGLAVYQSHHAVGGKAIRIPGWTGRHDHPVARRPWWNNSSTKLTAVHCDQPMVYRSEVAEVSEGLYIPANAKPEWHGKGKEDTDGGRFSKSAE
jgi:hypothetical protein